MPNPFETSPAGDAAADGAGAARPARVKMTPEATLGTALLAYAGANGLAGLFMLSFPRALWVSIGGADPLYEKAYASTRLAGAMMVTLAVMALLVVRKPARQSTLVTLLCIEETLVAAATFVNAAFDKVPTDVWFDWLIALGSIALAGFMWWARIVGRRALKEG
ncbi:MAG: hypothetical protein MUE66_07705 [Acidimicrobiia bacterium]|nr:hypothetical protein [Acidimicrobiia bacterium]